LNAPEPLDLRSPGTWIVLAPAIGLIALGLVLIISPRLGAAIFGIGTEGTGLRYVAALGVRDVAFGLYVAALALFASRRAVGIMLALTVLIPAGDIAILLTERGLSTPGHLLLHGLSGLYMAGAALWTLSGSRQGGTPE
jgi:hypothetical protein